MVNYIGNINWSYAALIILVFIAMLHTGYKKVRLNPIALHSFTQRDTLPLRGIMALLIIFGHVSSKFAENHSCYGFATFGTPAVSVFFFLSGYGLVASFQKKRKKYLSGFLTRTCIKIFTPFLIASAVWIGLSTTMFGGSLPDELVGFLIFKPPLPYSWFVYALMVFYIGFYFVYKYFPVSKTASKIATLFVFTFVVTVIYRTLEFGVYWYISLFAFNIGVLFSAYYQQISKTLVSKPIMCIVGLGIMLIVMMMMHIRTGLLAMIPLGVVIPLLYLGTGTNSRFLCFLGTISYEIYLCHGIFVPLFGRCGFSWSIYILCATACSICAAMILHRLSAAIQSLIENTPPR